MKIVKEIPDNVNLDEKDSSKPGQGCLIMIGCVIVFWGMFFYLISAL